jgi:hypothetical protein
MILTLSVTKFGRQSPDNGEFGEMMNVCFGSAAVARTMIPERLLFPIAAILTIEISSKQGSAYGQERTSVFVSCMSSETNTDVKLRDAGMLRAVVTHYPLKLSSILPSCGFRSQVL